MSRVRVVIHVDVDDERTHFANRDELGGSLIRSVDRWAAVHLGVRIAAMDHVSVPVERPGWAGHPEVPIEASTAPSGDLAALFGGAVALLSKFAAVEGEARGEACAPLTRDPEECWTHGGLIATCKYRMAREFLAALTRGEGPC